jgi:Lon protease-like protein
MFPLGTVLLPHVVLPLHVFEPRYRALTADCLAGDGTFGVVLIERGFEVGGGDERFDVGTLARIVQAASFDDGRWALVTVGTQRIRVREWIGDDPYPRALVDVLEDRPAGSDLPAALVAAESVVRRCLALTSELDEPSAAPAHFELSGDAEVAGWQLAAYAPLGPVDQLALLAEDDPVARAGLLERLASEQAAVLAYRLSSG